MKVLFLFLNKYFLTNVLLPFLIQMNTKPTGFFLVPPLGPAIPVIETEIFVLLILLKFLTITKQVSQLTAPYFLMIFFGTLSVFIFDWFEYVTKPIVKTLEDPLIDVIVLDSKPPVQDSAKEILNLFFLNNLTIF